MRHVKFPAGYHSSIYPDDKLLDFIITFSGATVACSGSCTVGSYTVTS